MPSIKSPEEQAIELIAPRKFHQIFTLPATENHGPLKVTYSILGPPVGEDAPTVVFCGGMFGSRYMIFSDYIAEKHGVRVLCIDRLVWDISFFNDSLWIFYDQASMSQPGTDIDHQVLST
jgi:hypothetical protein